MVLGAAQNFKNDVKLQSNNIGQNLTHIVKNKQQRKQIQDRF